MFDRAGNAGLSEMRRGHKFGNGELGKEVAKLRIGGNSSIIEAAVSRLAHKSIIHTEGGC